MHGITLHQVEQMHYKHVTWRKEGLGTRLTISALPPQSNTAVLPKFEDCAESWISWMQKRIIELPTVLYRLRACCVVW